MRTCAHCGRIVTDLETRYCPTCGSPLTIHPTDPQQVPTPPPYGAAPPMSTPQPPYGQTPAPTQPIYSQNYGAQGYPGAYRPGADWRPAKEPPRLPWGRIIGSIAVVLVLIAVVAAIYDQAHGLHPTIGPTAGATQTAVGTLSTTLLRDSMLTVDSGWANDSHCYFAQDGYHVAGSYLCFAPIGEQGDATESVTVKQISGVTTHSYGLFLRRSSVGNYYFFGVDSNSKWIFEKVVNDNVTRLQDFTVNAAINGGLNNENSLSVTATGSTFDCFVNGVKVGSVQDSTFDTGIWGLAGNDGINVVFTNYLATF